MKVQYDTHKRTEEFKVGDKVYLSTRKWGPYRGAPGQPDPESRAPSAKAEPENGFPHLNSPLVR
eukprot:777712-Prorocentrum_minimum.AAC.1